jgi:hypothetical protein
VYFHDYANTNGTSVKMTCQYGESYTFPDLPIVNDEIPFGEVLS